MMRYAFIATLLAALLAAACGGSESPRPSTPSPAPATAVRPEPLAPAPEGVLLVQRESRLPTTFGIAADGSVAERGNGFAYLPAPDGEHAAFLRGESQDRPSEVVIANAGGETFSDQGPEISSAAGVYPSLLWSPDGSRLAYTLQDESRWDRSHVYVVDADGSGLRRLTAQPGYHSLVGWTADGRPLVRDSGTLVLMGDENQTLPVPKKLRSAYPSFVMSPDGRRVAISGGDPEEQMELWVMEVDTGESRLVADMGRLASAPAEERYVSAGIPLQRVPGDADDPLMKGPPPVAWSPDGSRIAYYRNETSATDTFFSELRVVDVETGEDVSVTESGSWQATWSPDGRYLAEGASEHGGVVVLGQEGNVHTLDVQTNYILWAPDGRLVAIEGGGVSLVDPETGDAQQVRAPDGRAIVGAQGWGIVWSPEGRYMAVATNEDPGRFNGSLYVVDTRTAGATLVLEKGSFHPVAWLSR